MITRDHYGTAVGGTLPVIPGSEAEGGTAGAVGGAGGGEHYGGPLPQHRTHQRTFSHGQLVEGGRGHRRAASKTDFILPAGHEEREREKEEQRRGEGAAGGGAMGGGGTSSSYNKGHTRQASRTESVYTIRQHKRTMLQKLMFWKKTGEDGRTRTVHPNVCVNPGEPSPNAQYPDNSICTTKYTLLSFLPKNLFEQFHRFANLYFLFIVLLNFVPAVNAFGKEVAMLPLIFVLGITAIKDAFEDRRRYLSDRRVNYATCRVYSR
ncbi:hypothetical protein Pmani_029035 [Petrolisthes manimaculis]|uniref:P-type ATPase N-terminal domain-containing protein n=1 Tax=Petrolisthes manimaculis TaxID=1843537 RepID=A0AAE1NYE2_9EUCA|nr:hypothetical protein Pmani_029035 [Petrolisthes manimaculis]